MGQLSSILPATIAWTIISYTVAAYDCMRCPAETPQTASERQQVGSTPILACAVVGSWCGLHFTSSMHWA